MSLDNMLLNGATAAIEAPGPGAPLPKTIEDFVREMEEKDRVNEKKIEDAMLKATLEGRRKGEDDTVALYQPMLARCREEEEKSKKAAEEWQEKANSEERLKIEALKTAEKLSNEVNEKSATLNEEIGKRQEAEEKVKNLEAQLKMQNALEEKIRILEEQVKEFEAKKAKAARKSIDVAQKRKLDGEAFLHKLAEVQNVAHALFQENNKNPDDEEEVQVMEEPPTKRSKAEEQRQDVVLNEPIRSSVKDSVSEGLVQGSPPTSNDSVMDFFTSVIFGTPDNAMPTSPDQQLENGMEKLASSSEREPIIGNVLDEDQNVRTWSDSVEDELNQAIRSPIDNRLGGTSSDGIGEGEGEAVDEEETGAAPEARDGLMAIVLDGGDAPQEAQNAQPDIPVAPQIQALQGVPAVQDPVIPIVPVAQAPVPNIQARRAYAVGAETMLHRIGTDPLVQEIYLGSKFGTRACIWNPEKDDGCPQVVGCVPSCHAIFRTWRRNFADNSVKWRDVREDPVWTTNSNVLQTEQTAQLALGIIVLP